MDQFVFILSIAVKSCVAVLFASLGEIYAERSGVLNLGVEGMMLGGALAGAAAGLAFGDPWLAVGCGMLAGGALALIHAFFSVTLGVNQTLSGLALTILGSGLASFLGRPLVGHVGVRFKTFAVPYLADIPMLGRMLFRQNALVYVAYVLAPLLWWVLRRSRLGLRIRAAGEDAPSADAMGVPVARIRYGCTLFGGLMAGLGGCYLSLAYTPGWKENMTAGQGWIAIAMVLFASWSPLRASLGALLFGFLTALQFYFQVSGVEIIPIYVLKMLPYLLTIVVLVLVLRFGKGKGGVLRLGWEWRLGGSSDIVYHVSVFLSCISFPFRYGGRMDTRNIHKIDLAYIKGRLDAISRQRIVQQGKGVPIISLEHGGVRFVWVGNELHYSRSWLTFTDFLGYYIKIKMGKGWGNAELRKEEALQHPVIKWYKEVCKQQEAARDGGSGVFSAKMTGAIAAYFGLAYNLYLVAHNVELQTKLLKRLRRIKTFHGAYYEIFVAAAFIRAGFDLDFEDESDGRTSHCEFVATHKASGKKYSVEAKARHVIDVLGADKEESAADPRNIKLTRKLVKALKKNANHDRIVFIDVNCPNDIGGEGKISWLENMVSVLRSEENQIFIGGVPAPPAYVFVTNFPYHYELNETECRTFIFMDGFKIQDFEVGKKYRRLLDVVERRNRHAEVIELFDALQYQAIPSTFDGDYPEFAFGENDAPRLIIGEKYILDDQEGNEIVAKLEDAVVDGFCNRAICVYRTDDARRYIYTNELSETELAAYKRHPDTFLGVYKPVSRGKNDQVDAYTFYYDAYKDTPKDKLLEFMGDYGVMEPYRSMKQEELAKFYCERMAMQLWTRISERK